MKTEGAKIDTASSKMCAKSKEAIRDTLFTVKIRGLTCKSKKKDVKQFFSPLKAKSVRLCRQVKGIAYVGFNTEKEMKQALNKNKSFLGMFVAYYSYNL
jgi:multiple RNA-binding domain-containing protein 1